VFIVSDLNPRALSPKLSGFAQAHCWFQNAAPIVFSNRKVPAVLMGVLLAAAAN
jgi:hypothetical protein